MDLITPIILIVIILVLVLLIPGLKLITDSEVGILTKRMFGRKMPQGQVVARNGEIGVQADILMPGLYWRIPVIWKIQKDTVTEILPTEVGIVESIDGRSIPKGTRRHLPATGRRKGASAGRRRTWKCA